MLWSIPLLALTLANPADAFFAFVYVFSLLDLREVRELIRSAKQPGAGRTFPRLWRKIRIFLFSLELCGKASFKSIRSETFLRRATVTTPGDIDRVIREERRRVMMPSYSYAAGMPFAVLENVVDFMGSFVCDFGYDSSRLRSKRRSVAREIRRDLASMALVHRTWTHLVQLVLRRRVAVRSLTSMHHFMRSPNCGPWVQELVIDFPPPKMKIDKETSNDEDEPELCQSCGEYHRHEGGHEVEIEDEEDPFAHPDVSAVWPSICMLLGCLPDLRRLSVLMQYRTFAELVPTINLEGIRLFIHILGSLKSLEGLSLRSLAFHDSPKNPLFSDFCKQLSTLSNLRRFAIQGFTSIDEIDLPQSEGHPSKVSFDKYAPFQLRTLALSIAEEPYEQSSASLAWLLRSRDTLENLFIHFSILESTLERQNRMASHILAFLSPPGQNLLHFPVLRRLRFQLYDSPIPYFKGRFAKAVTGFFENCPKLSDLYISYATAPPKLVLPASLVNLTLSFHHDSLMYGSDVQIFIKWDEKIVKLFKANLNGLPKLERLTIVMYTREPMASVPKGMELLKMAFGQSLKWCRDKKVEIAFEDETNSSMYFDERMNNFAFA